MSGIITAILTVLLGASSIGLPVYEKELYLSSHRPLADRVLSDISAKPPIKIDPISLGPEMRAQSAILVDKDSGAVLYEKNSRAVRPLASITKLMSALVFLEANPDLAKRVRMVQADQREGNSQHIRPGEEAALEHYLRASLVTSANNATIVLSRSTGTTTVEFIKKMNEKARALGMTSTVFVEPTGLDPANVSTARDTVKMLAAARENDIIRKLTSIQKSVVTVYKADGSFEQREITNTDELLGTFVDIQAGKTGYLDESLYNLAAAVALDEAEVLAVVLGAESTAERFQSVKNLSVWAESTYKW